MTGIITFGSYVSWGMVIRRTATPYCGSETGTAQRLNDMKQKILGWLAVGAGAAIVAVGIGYGMKLWVRYKGINNCQRTLLSAYRGNRARLTVNIRPPVFSTGLTDYDRFGNPMYRFYFQDDAHVYVFECKTDPTARVLNAWKTDEF